MMHDGWSGMMGGTGLYWLVAGLVVVVVVLAWGLAKRRSRDGGQYGPRVQRKTADGVAISRRRGHSRA